MIARRFCSRWAVALSCAATLALAVASGACSKPKPPRQYQLRGVVVRLDGAANEASINAEKIEGWMEPMTMDYPIQSGEDYKALHVADKVTATVNVTKEKYWLTNVRRQGN